MTLTGEVDWTPITAGAKGRDKLMNDLGAIPTAILGIEMVLSGVVGRVRLILLLQDLVVGERRAKTSSRVRLGRLSLLTSK